eukprot:10266129-Alexandrium_andersonii.AAC.1
MPALLGTGSAFSLFGPPAFVNAQREQLRRATPHQGHGRHARGAPPALDADHDALLALTASG